MSKEKSNLTLYLPQSCIEELRKESYRLSNEENRLVTVSELVREAIIAIYPAVRHAWDADQ